MMQETGQLLDHYRADFAEVLSEQPALKLVLDATPDLIEKLEQVWIASDFVATLCLTNPALLADILIHDDINRDYRDWAAHHAAWQTRAMADHPGNDQVERLKVELRRFRKREMLRIIWRDVHKLASLQQTCRDLSALADISIARALAVLTPLLQQQHGVPFADDGQEQQLIILAMGKYGAFELNLSSDIDLIFTYPDNGETTLTEAVRQQFPRAQVTTVQQYFCKLGQQLINVLDTLTSEGRVFRVDMRLRPYGASGALALSIDAMEEYYQSQGRDWERFAMIKVRAVTGAQQSVAYLMSVLRAFTYRRYIDFATIDSLRDLKRQIEQQVRRKGMHDNIKLGRGGIREIEFIVQVLQLIYAGRHRQLQCASIMTAMNGLVQEQAIAADDAQELKQCYDFLRRLEHAIQALEDKQTHDYPQDAFLEYRIAHSLGFGTTAALRANLNEVRDKVAEHFASLIAAPVDSVESETDSQMQAIWNGSIDEDKALAILQQQGFIEGEGLLKALENYRSSRAFLALESSSRERMDRFMPHLLERLSEEAKPDLGFNRIFPFVQTVARRTAYLVLLLENPLALSQLIMLCSASPWMVEQLSRYPALLDELLRPLNQPPARDALRDRLRQQLLRTPDNALDEQLVTIQNFKQEQILNVAAAELSGTMALMKVSDYLTWVAEVVLEQIVEIAWQLLTAKFGFPYNVSGDSGEMDFVVIGYGKMGGVELNYGSDLDLVFMHDGHQDEDTTGGDKGVRINSGAFYVQLGQKILSLLNTHTVAGRLYEIDMRLRPSGASGALVCSVQAFEQYQRENAWTWEHQALSRARAVCGSASLMQVFADIRQKILALPREREVLAQEIVSMRHKMRKTLGSRDPAASFHLKQDSGGLVDIEFIVQYLVLAHGAQVAPLLEFSDNMRLLDIAAANGLLPAEHATTLQEVYIGYRSHLHKRALDNADYKLGADEFAQERIAVIGIWESLFAGIEPGEVQGGGGIANPS